ncbi:MFS transporter [Taklimakanibacter deserti]|uniref:MFS transporter n=1 Tax=Taklimakanibacter deserti TaxID=2267839 RepID=UPI000E64C445
MTRPEPRPALVICTLGVFQILAWGSSFYLLGVLAPAITADTGWPPALVVSGLSLALLAAGIVSPKVGRTIQQHGGRPVLATSSVLLAGGLIAVGLATTPWIYLIAWLLIGLGMGTGLYDPAFATLGRQYGQSARRMITAVTLFGGFASTICWPISAFLLEKAGWRSTCFAYAAAHLSIGLPAYWFLMPKSVPSLAGIANSSEAASRELPADRQTVAFWLLGTILTVGAAILSLVAMHLLVLLQERGLGLGMAVALGALVGPSQVAARVVELLAGRRFHPVWTMLVGVVLLALGITLLWLEFPIIALALIAYGAGNGISSIVRGTVPLALFGPGNYAILMGRLGLPILLAMAAAPILGTVLIDAGGAALAFAVLAGMSLANILLVAALIRWSLR